MKFSCFMPCVAGSACVLLLATAAHADIIYNNFGPGGSHVGNGGATVANAMFFGAYIEAASAFTVAGDGDYYLNEIHLVVGMLWGPNYVTVSIYDDAGGQPGSALGTVTLIDQMMDLPGDDWVHNPAMIADFGNSIVLLDGLQYWVVVGPHPVEDAWLAWNDNDTGAMGPVGSHEDGGPWNIADMGISGVFAVHGTLVPGPGGLALLLIAGTALRRRRR